MIDLHSTDNTKGGILIAAQFTVEGNDTSLTVAYSFHEPRMAAWVIDAKAQMIELLLNHTDGALSKGKMIGTICCLSCCLSLVCGELLALVQEVDPFHLKGGYADSSTGALKNARGILRRAHSVIAAYRKQYHQPVTNLPAELDRSKKWWLTSSSSKPLDWTPVGLPNYVSED